EPEIKVEIENAQKDDHVEENVNNGNSNRNRNGNPNVNNRGNVIAAEPTRLQDAIRVANNLMDQKLKGYAIKNTENKRRVGHVTRDYRTAVAATLQKAPIENQTRNVCYECGRPVHYRNECPKLRNQYRRNKTGNKTGNNEAKVRAYAIGGGGADPNSNDVMGTFLLNNRYATMLFDLGADRSFMSTTFSTLLDVSLSTLDTSYAVEFADGRISETNVILKGCTLGLLGHPLGIDLMPLELDSFNVIVGVDWLAKYHAMIVCDERIILNAQAEARKGENYVAEDLHGMINKLKPHADGTLCLNNIRVIHFGEQGKLNPRYIRPFKIIAKVGTVAYCLELPKQLSRFHSTFHVSNLKKCLSDETLVIPLDEI
ncbi:putative reverse transcriptase domain-containing protein, partial [Tanacetum coccineum]